MGAVLRSLFVDYEIIKETNYRETGFAVYVRSPFLFAPIPVFMVYRNGKF